MKKGFTLIELLVVIAIIGLLSTLATVAFNSARDRTGYETKICATGESSSCWYTNDYFEGSNGCVIIEQDNNKEVKVCGNYSIEDLSD